MIRLLQKTSMRAVSTVALSAILLALSACSTKTAETAPNLAVPVTVAKAVQKTVPINLTAIGTAEAFTTVSIKAQVNAVLEEVHFKTGRVRQERASCFSRWMRGRFRRRMAQARSEPGA